MVQKKDCYKDAHLVLKELEAIKLIRKLLPSEQKQHCELLSLLQTEKKSAHTLQG